LLFQASSAIEIAVHYLVIYYLRERNRLYRGIPGFFLQGLFLHSGRYSQRIHGSQLLFWFKFTI